MIKNGSKGWMERRMKRGSWLGIVSSLLWLLIMLARTIPLRTLPMSLILKDDSPHDSRISLGTIFRSHFADSTLWPTSRFPFIIYPIAGVAGTRNRMDFFQSLFGGSKISSFGFRYLWNLFTLWRIEWFGRAVGEQVLGIDQNWANVIFHCSDNHIGFVLPSLVILRR